MDHSQTVAGRMWRMIQGEGNEDDDETSTEDGLQAYVQRPEDTVTGTNQATELAIGTVAGYPTHKEV